MKNKILIITGDPKSINSEIIIKTLKKIPQRIKKKIYLISNYELLKNQFKKFHFYPKMQKVDIFKNDIKNDRLKIINIDLPFKNLSNISFINCKRYIKKSFDLAHDISLNDKSIIGIINCPINKKLLNNGNFGVTEYLASKCQIKDSSEVMLIRNDKLAVSPVTTHNDLKSVSKILSKNLIVKKINTINLYFKKIFLRKPKIAVLGLNPHNGELKKKTEEVRIIIPAIKRLKKKNIRVYGPLVSDTIFINDYKKFDVIVGMYHDQVLGPFKALYKFNAINLTLGLKYLRVSPDHGVAINLIGKNKANPTSLLECVKFLNKFG